MEKIFRHFKGGYYRFITEVTNSETLEKEVVYQALYGECKVWTRPADMFYGKVNVDGVEIDRFTEVVGVPVLFKKTNENAIMPTKAHDDDFCYDCYAVSEEEVAPNVWKNTVSDLRYRLKTETSLLTFQDALRSVLVLPYGRLV